MIVKMRIGVWICMIWIEHFHTSAGSKNWMYGSLLYHLKSWVILLWWGWVNIPSSFELHHACTNIGLSECMYFVLPKFSAAWIQLGDFVLLKTMQTRYYVSGNKCIKIATQYWVQMLTEMGVIQQIHLIKMKLTTYTLKPAGIKIRMLGISWACACDQGEWMADSIFLDKLAYVFTSSGVSEFSLPI